MIILVTVIHVLVCIGLILVVLLQTGKGAEVGAVFGGSSATIFGSSGAGNFLSRLTTGMAIVFMITSLTLGYFAGRKPSATIFDTRSSTTAPSGTSAPKQETTPTTPPQAPAQPGAPKANPSEKPQTP
jgi:preprotein translocase subunit SecG